MNKKQYERFMKIRARAFVLINKIIQETGHCKSYEGATEVTLSFPDIFAGEDETECAIITFHCYLMGNGRHHDFRGKTMDDALDEFERFIEKEAKMWEDKP